MALAQAKDREFNRLIIFNVSVLIFFGILLLIGTFFDETISRGIYSPDNLIARMITTLGTVPFFFMAVFFIGCLLERIFHSGLGKVVRYALFALCSLLGLVVGFFGVGAFLDRDCLGSFFPVLDRNTPVIAVLAIVATPILLRLGYLMAGTTDDKMLVRRIIALLILLGLSYLALYEFKNVFHRPRFRLVVSGIDGIGYTPWYTPFPAFQSFIDSLGINATEFRSFPSGHSILSTSCVFTFQSLSWFPKFKGKDKLALGAAGLIFAIVIMFTRVILGAHYLSDVSAGAMISTLLALVYTIVQKQIIF